VMDTIEWSDPGVRYREPPMVVKNIFGKFFDVSTPAGPAFSRPQAGRGLATGDLDGDGRLDVVINNNNSPATVLHNTTTPSANWIDVRLEGAKSNRDGYGSVVLVTTEAGVEARAYSDSSGSYLSASSPILHFGLGSDRAKRIEVRWPSGLRTVQEIKNLNTLVRLRE
jgi:enediyne biosynthesis protein E4